MLSYFIRNFADHEEIWWQFCGKIGIIKDIFEKHELAPFSYGMVVKVDDKVRQTS